MLIALILAGVVAGPAADQAAPDAHPEIRQDVRVFTMGPDGPGPHGAAMDKNGDGFVTREEFTAPQTQAFDFLDKNRDGKISTEEFAEGRAAAAVVLGGPGRRGPVRIHMGGPEGGLPGAPMASFTGDDGQMVFIRRDGPGGDMPPPPGANIQIHRIGGPGGEGPGDLDKDHDGKISQEEFEAPLREAFERMDKNHSGFIEADENGDGAGVHVFTRRMTAPAD
jgi:hypothetical protein